MKRLSFRSFLMISFSVFHLMNVSQINAMVQQQAQVGQQQVVPQDQAGQLPLAPALPQVVQQQAPVVPQDQAGQGQLPLAPALPQVAPQAPVAQQAQAGQGQAPGRFRRMISNPKIVLALLSTLSTSPVVLNLIFKGKESYLVNFLKLSGKIFKETFSSNEVAKNSLKYGLGSTVMIGLLQYNKIVLDLLKNGATLSIDAIDNSVTSCWDSICGIFDGGDAAVKKRFKRAGKVSFVLFAAIGLNYLLRKENSSFSHIKEHGHVGIIPNIYNQFESVFKSVFSMFEKTPNLPDNIKNFAPKKIVPVRGSVLGNKPVGFIVKYFGL